MEVSKEKQIKFYKQMIDQLDDEMLKNPNSLRQEKIMKTKQELLKKLRKLRGI